MRGLFCILKRETTLIIDRTVSLLFIKKYEGDLQDVFMTKSDNFQVINAAIDSLAALKHEAETFQTYGMT